MKKRKSSINKLKPNKIGFQSSMSIYKEKFSEEEITFKPKFSSASVLEEKPTTKIWNNKINIKILQIIDMNFFYHKYLNLTIYIFFFFC